MAEIKADIEISTNLRHIPLSYNSAKSQISALRLILTLFPEWKYEEGKIEFIRFTDGITNTLLKAIKRRPGYTEEQIDQEAVLLRAYGSGTEILIDRDQETASHSLLAQHHLAPPLLARFQNGLLYRFIQGRVCTPEDLRREEVWRAVARRLGEWHAQLPIIASRENAIPAMEERESGEPHTVSSSEQCLYNETTKAINAITPHMATPNLWTVLQKWIFALPTKTETEEKRKNVLQKELERTVSELGDTSGLGKEGLIFGHCDLLSGNVIIHPTLNLGSTHPNPLTVSFIDYEYATSCPPAFDLANHFAEWGGLSCDFGMLPTRSTRHAFLREYLDSYTLHHPLPSSSPSSSSSASTSAAPSSPSTPSSESPAESLQEVISQEQKQHFVDDLEACLFEEVDRFRGIPGFYWGVWALIQKTISQIDFDYGSYAEVRLGEYWAWRGEGEKGKGEERERRWASE